MRIYSTLFFCVSALFSFSTQAAKITTLKIEGNTVIFTQSGTKDAASPACAASLPTSWGLQLLTDTDRATYAALVTAAGSNMDIVVTSAQNCLEDSAVEQVKSIEVRPVVAAIVEQGMKIVAIGSSNRYGANVSYSALSADGTPYMYKSGSGEYQSVNCRHSVAYSTSDTSSKNVMCLKM